MTPPRRTESIPEDPYAEQRRRMVGWQLRERGIRDPRVLEAMGEVPRHRFVPPRERHLAYADAALPIGHGQTISQPLMVASMLQALALRGDERVLDVGAGSGYQAALLGRLARQVWAVEIVAELAQGAREVLAEIGCDNVHVVTGDGSVGYEEAVPYDAIVVGAAATHVPEPLYHQLAEAGRLVIPVGDPALQTLVRIQKTPSGPRREHLGFCAFVPLVGAEGEHR